ncbi:hypothetical protein [Pseudomonas aeruginosa]|uniref:hypothetical protein n=1 Tax=Pseudomonas aeruginosa TaxID=287 RepID=UPI002FDF8ABB
MQTMLVSPLFKASAEGPVSSESRELIHLRQGDLDGACGPYCMVSALIALGLMTRKSAKNMDRWDGRTREGRFRDALYAFGVLSSEGTNGDDLQWLTDHFKGVGLQARYVEGVKKQVFNNVADAIESGDMPIIGVEWPGGGGHWMLAVGYQGAMIEDELQLTHLLCLDPNQELPKVSLWNAVLEVFDDQGASVNQGRMSSNHWGMSGELGKCQIKDTVILSLSER